jgi:hypothetical protein
MNSSVALQIENSIAAALSGEGAPALVDRAVTIEYVHENMPAYNLAEVKYEPMDHESTDDSIAGTSHWVVMCYALGDSQMTARAAADPLLVYAWQQLQDETFGNLCRIVRVSGYQCNYDRKNGIEVIEVQLNLEVEFDVVRGDPSQNYNATEG